MNESRTAYDTTKLTIAYNTSERAEKVLESYRAHTSTAALGFCASIEHAKFMAQEF
jgi:superfamily II DNA or RNA helicase